MDRIEFLTKAECAEILQVSETTVERMIASGQLPAYRISRAVTRINKADLMAYLAQRQIKAAALRRSAGVKDLRKRKRMEARPCGYIPGMKVVDPHA